MPHVVRLILTGRQPRHFAGLRSIMNINEVQRSNGDTRRYLVVEWCGTPSTVLKISKKGFRGHLGPHSISYTHLEQLYIKSHIFNDGIWYNTLRQRNDDL